MSRSQPFGGNSLPNLRYLGIKDSSGADGPPRLKSSFHQQFQRIPSHSFEIYVQPVPPDRLTENLLMKSPPSNLMLRMPPRARSIRVESRTVAVERRRKGLADGSASSWSTRLLGVGSKRSRSAQKVAPSSESSAFSKESARPHARLCSPGDMAWHARTSRTRSLSRVDGIRRGIELQYCNNHSIWDP
jgi:hypothetical protein